MNCEHRSKPDADQPMGQHPTDEQLTDCQVSSYHSWGTSVGKFERGFEVKKFCLQCLKESNKRVCFSQTSAWLERENKL